MFTRPSRITNRSRVRKTDKQKDKQTNPNPQQQPGVWRVLSMLSMVVFGGGLVVASVAGYGLWRTGDQFMDGVKLMFTPKPPEDTVDTRTLIVEQIQGASELTTAIFSMEAVVPTESNRTVGNYVIGQTNLLYIAHGEVRAGIDLGAISEENVQVINDSEDLPPSLILTLPAPKVLDSKLDVTRSKVYEYDRGFLSLGPDRAPELQALAQQEALKQIRQGACDEGILTMASERAELTMRQLIEPLGYENLTVNVAEPTGCS
ncbi:DUF4230 domain-containing protein [Leptolyngbyaceae cyanobacterium CCMR0082]|uniref:DUF4230 domain-containing protein n=1 Tax=Adonisia turfae CCMR0082 TaxID=2304604 RepID=A0A6M0S220_9CYAN|nr:DUF4230 domain-containing protein [Adonisia turfae]MDV3349121.1 DUF4230 domain-containing protein [Leptothoe sp. LEGE 181152]NEZ62143.1 DUF4230 domain-containing protein [Adonisia turfae CCMR0082]